MSAYARPTRLDDALALLAGGGWRVLAGGTDVYPGQPAALAGDVLDVTALPEMRGIGTGDGLRIGACTTWSEIAEAALPPALHGLQQAARQVGGRQIQNAGTIGGNLCNASPAADGVPALLTLDAVVELASARGTRRLPLANFLTGPRQTARAADEVLLALHLPASALTGRSAFLKLGARAHLVISIAMVAVRCVAIGGIVTEMAASVGACGPVATRLPRVEAALTGAPVAGLAGRIRPEDVAAHLSPIDDVRASAAYRAEAATELLCRAVTEVAR
ncbi:MAG: FAD binding domain-containing protein [Rhodobacteraceae bacterium]|nr:FAD binding domain-containing protein [Paracoccaceae bacterium]